MNLDCMAETYSALKVLFLVGFAVVLGYAIGYCLGRAHEAGEKS